MVIVISYWQLYFNCIITVKVLPYFSVSHWFLCVFQLQYLILQSFYICFSNIDWISFDLISRKKRSILLLTFECIGGLQLKRMKRYWKQTITIMGCGWLCDLRAFLWPDIKMAKKFFLSSSDRRRCMGGVSFQYTKNDKSTCCGNMTDLRVSTQQPL